MGQNNGEWLIHGSKNRNENQLQRQNILVGM